MFESTTSPPISNLQAFEDTLQARRLALLSPVPTLCNTAKTSHVRRLAKYLVPLSAKELDPRSPTS